MLGQDSWLSISPRSADAHKGTFGRVAVVGGSWGMSGSICLAATAALRGGAGLVSAVVPQAIQSIVAGYEPSVMTIGLPCNELGELASVALAQIKAVVSDLDCVGVGPGLGRSGNAADLVRAIIQESPCPIVLDADALNLASEQKMFPLFSRRQASGGPACVVTPHPGEFARMTGRTTVEVNQDREGLAKEFAQEFGCVVVLKGPSTVVTDGSKVFVNGTGNSGMATGGSGDVLTGILAAQIAQGLSCFEAGCLAVHVHGLAGDLAVKVTSERGLIASDLLRFLGEAWLFLEHRRSGSVS